MTLQVRDGAANKEKKGKKKKENHNVSQLLPWLLDKIRACFEGLPTRIVHVSVWRWTLWTQKAKQSTEGSHGTHCGVSVGDLILGLLGSFGETAPSQMCALSSYQRTSHIRTISLHLQWYNDSFTDISTLHTQSHRSYSIRPIPPLLFACLRLCRGSHT